MWAKNRRCYKRTPWNCNMILLSIFIQLRKTAIMWGRPWKDYNLFICLSPIKSNQTPRVQPPNPWRERRLGMRWLRRSPWPRKRAQAQSWCTRRLQLPWTSQVLVHAHKGPRNSPWSPHAQKHVHVRLTHQAYFTHQGKRGHGSQLFER